MEENNQPHHQTIPENRLTPLQHGIQHARRNGSCKDTKKGWLCALLEWTNTTRHDLITCNLWPKPETTTSQEVSTMPMHDKQWGTDGNSLKSQATTANSKTWADPSTKPTTPRSISTAATSD
jgi:hypothetical protein